MKVLVTGSAGMLGQRLFEAFTPDCQVWGVDLNEMDVTSFEKTRRVISSIGPDWVVHAAAFTRVDDAEREIRETYRINSLGTRNVAVAALESGCAVLYFSTDYVFGGSAGRPYTEFDSASPVNEYGRSKLMGEIFLRDLNSRHLIVRTSWLYGPGGPNFVDKIREKARTDRLIPVVNDQFGCPTYTRDLAQFCVELTRRNLRGTYHVTNSGYCSWFELAEEIVALLGADVRVEPVATADFPRAARRPPFSVLENSMLQLEGLPLLRSWKEALAEHLVSNRV